jgi:uncharacterized membrane protein YccC
MNTAARLQHHPLLHALLQTSRRNVPVVVALRNTAAIVVPLAVGAWFGRLEIGLAIGTGALVTMFADQPGPYRLRLQRLLLAALAAGVAAWAGAVLGQWRGALLAAATLWSFAAALLVAVGPHATRAGLISMILLIILGAEPMPATKALPIAALIFGGGLLQAVAAIAAWPLQRYHPERMALAAVFRDLAANAGREVAANATIALPPSLNELHESLYGSGRARGRAVEAFRVLTELAERIRLELFALAQQQALATNDAEHATLQRARASAAEVLAAIATALDKAEPPDATQAIADFAHAASAHEAGAPDPAHDIGSAHLAALGGQLRAALRNADTAGSRGEIRAESAELRLPVALRPAGPLQVLRANLRLGSPAFRHALRCSACILIALLLAGWLPLSRSYWMPMTVAIVLKPDFGATWRYGLLRVAGTLGGLLLTTIALHFVGVGNFWIALALMAVLCFAYRELAIVHYGIAVVCLTGLVVILLSFYGIPPETAVHARALDTVLGSALALIAYLAWPTWERGREREALARMLDAYRDYLAAVLQGDARALHETRVAARAARSEAQASLERLRVEPSGRANLPRAEALVAQANRCVRVAMLLEASRAPSGNHGDIDASARFASACTAALTECAAALREGRPPVTEGWQLRVRQQDLARILAPHDGSIPSTWDTALLDASDRIVDAIDSVAHALQRR